MFEDVETKRKVRRFRARCLICQAEKSLIDDRNVDPWGWVKSDPIIEFISWHRAECGSGNERIAGVEMDEVELDTV